MLAAMERGVALVVRTSNTGWPRRHRRTRSRGGSGCTRAGRRPRVDRDEPGTGDPVDRPDKNRVAQEEIVGRMRALLIEPIGQLGRPDPARRRRGVQLHHRRDARYVDSGKQPGPKDIDHLVRFCLAGLGVAEGGR